MAKSALDWIVSILLIVGALDLGLVGIGSFTKSNLNVINLILGSIPSLENIIYILVGLAGLYTIYNLVKK